MHPLCTSGMPFTFFPHLSTEIRFQIWQEAIPPARVLRVLLTHKLETFVYPSEVYRTPVILHVCQESRQIGLRIFRHDLSTLGNDPFWWNPHVDVVFRVCLAPVKPQGYRAPDFALSDEAKNTPERSFKTLQYMENTRHLAVPLNLETLEFLSLNLPRSKEIRSPQWLRQFPRLKSLVLLLDSKTDWIAMGDVVMLSLSETPIEVLNGESPSKIMKMVEKSLASFRLSAKSDWIAPTVATFAMKIRTVDDEGGFWLPEVKKIHGEWMAWQI